MFHVEQLRLLENRHAKLDFLPLQAGCFHFGVTPATSI
jgi:hypothetical protein